MAFSKETKIKAMLDSARHCCVCHRYRGVRVEVHHIVPVAQGGTDSDDNAIALCFDCHADAGHYNPKHPRGNKFSPNELRLAKEVWHAAVLNNRIDITEDEKWRSFQVAGSMLQLQSGIASTISNPNGCSASWFSGNSTVILGSGEIEGKRADSHTIATWEIEMAPYWQSHFKKGFIVIGCLRYFGGLHTKKYGAQVQVIFDKRPIDGFGLMIVAQNHTDYFHRIPLPPQLLDVEIWPLSACQTTYAWPIQKDILSPNELQSVTVQIENEVSWDIDYVAIVSNT